MSQIKSKNKFSGNEETVDENGENVQNKEESDKMQSTHMDKEIGKIACSLFGKK